MNLSITLSYLILLLVGLLIAWQMHRLPSPLIRTIAWVAAILLGAFLALTFSGWYTYHLAVHIIVWIAAWWLLNTALLRLRKRRTLWIICSTVGLLILVLSFAAERIFVDFSTGGSGELTQKVPNTEQNLEIFREGDFLLDTNNKRILLRQSMWSGLFYKNWDEQWYRGGSPCPLTFNGPDNQTVIFDHCQEKIIQE